MKSINVAMMVGAIGITALVGCSRGPSERDLRHTLGNNVSVWYANDRIPLYYSDKDGHIDRIVGEGREFVRGGAAARSRIRSYVLTDSAQYWADQYNNAQAHLRKALAEIEMAADSTAAEK